MCLPCPGPDEVAAAAGAGSTRADFAADSDSVSPGQSQLG